jgi:signal transduction histidine kinase
VYRRIVPVINSEGYTDAVALISLETDALENLSIYMKRNATYLFAISLILGLIAAYFAAKLSVRDVNHVRNEIEGMKGGSLEPMSVDGMFRETQELTKDINDIFNKAQLLEESRQEFVSNVSHELKTPITSMKVLSESLLTQSDVPAEMYREFMEDIVQEMTLKKNQGDSFLRNAEIQVAKLYSDAFSVMYSTDAEGMDNQAFGFGSDESFEVMKKTAAGIGVTNFDHDHPASDLPSNGGAS